jgi:hypothetical protein
VEKGRRNYEGGGEKEWRERIGIEEESRKSKKVFLRWVWKEERERQKKRNGI